MDKEAEGYRFAERVGGGEGWTSYYSRAKIGSSKRVDSVEGEYTDFQRPGASKPVLEKASDGQDATRFNFI